LRFVTELHGVAYRIPLPTREQVMEGRPETAPLLALGQSVPKGSAQSIGSGI
jgi:hypothetical protein